MCWSAGASAVLAGAGLGMTAYLIKKGEKSALWIPLFYLTLIEFLQITTYLYINQCSLPMNNILSFLGYAHIALQPLFINFAALYFIPEAVKNKIAPFVYAICGLVVVPFMLSAYPFRDTALCSMGLDTICVPFTCSPHGNWVSSWPWAVTGLSAQIWTTFANMPALGLQPLLYIVTGMFLPILYGSWRIILAATLIGPVLANFFLSSIHVFSSLWCLYSLGISCVLIKCPVRKYLYAHHWPLYQYCIPKRLQTPSIEHTTKTIEQMPPVEINTLIPIYSLSLPLHEFQLMHWFSGFSQPIFKTQNVVNRKRFKGRLNKIALDAALQLVLQKQEIFSYHIHRFYPLQTLCTRPSLHFRRVIEISLVNLPDDVIETYLNQKYEDLYYEKTWRVNRPWLSIQIYNLKNNQVEIQVCMSQLIADQYSMNLFFRELSNAYLFFTHQTHAYTLDSFQSYQHYITRKTTLVQQRTHADELFWKKYLQDTGLFCFPKQYVIPYKESTVTHLPLPESFILKLQKFCFKHQVELNDVVCAAVSLALLKCCGTDIYSVPPKLCINSIKSTRDDPQYDNTIGCFLRMDTIKLDLHNRPTLVRIAKQARQSMLETAVYQNAPSLVKLAALGQLSKMKKPLTKFFIGMGLTAAAKCFPKWQLNSSIINACKNIVISDRKKQFLICVDIHNNFVQDHIPTAQPILFGLPKQDIPIYNPPLHAMNYVLNIILHRDNDQSVPFLAIVGNLHPEFKTKLGETLISIVQRAVKIS